MSRRDGLWGLGLGLIIGLGGVPAGEAQARAGYVGPTVSTWDTRASSVVAGANVLQAQGRVFSAFTYNTNFSATSGNLSSQFGVHYLNLSGEERVDLFPDDEGAPGAVHGVSAGAITLLNRPLSARHPNGLAKVSLGVYAGVVPSALVGIDRNYLTLPVVAGLGVPVAPLPWLSVTPWGEVMVSYDFDTYLRPDEVDLSLLEGETEPTAEDVLQILSDALVVDNGPAVTGRGGLLLAGHLGSRWDLHLGFTLASLELDDGRAVAWGGSAGLVFHWDRVVPAVLPAAAE